MTRLSLEQLLSLYNDAPLSELSFMADKIRRSINGNNVLYNRNFHIEPSNICIHRCEFCSYRRENSTQEGAWSMSLEQIEQYCRDKYIPGMTEVHIVGSVHPEKDFDYYLQIIKKVRKILPKEVAIKGYSAVEIFDMSRGRPIIETLLHLKEAGLDAIPGGGAEILKDSVREKICPDKCTASQWLEIHKIAHRVGIRSNATMLFGHIESRKERLEHILKIRDLQDETSGFDAFIPLKYLTEGNIAAGKYNITPVSITEIMRTYAISRIALDNVKHIKAYWPMLGKENMSMALLFGADDIDGTINDSTKIYSMAGACDTRPSISVSELCGMVHSAGYVPVERDSFYR
jgi:aminodeoxyfutalosine synthase